MVDFGFGPWLVVAVGSGLGLDVGSGGFGVVLGLFWLATTLVIVPCKCRIASKIRKKLVSARKILPRCLHF